MSRVTTNPTERLRFLPRIDRGAHDLAPCVWRLMQAATRYREVYELIPTLGGRWDGRHASLRAPAGDPGDLHINFENGTAQEDARRLTMLSSESVHHLRTALDYLAFQTVLRDNGSPREQTQFPICKDRRSFNKQHPYRLPGITRQHREWVEAVQPYRGVEWSQILVELSNRDKHRFPIDVVPAYTFGYDPTIRFADPEGDPAFVGFQVEDPNLSFLFSDTRGPDGSSREVTGALLSLIHGVSDLLNVFLEDAGQEPVTVTSVQSD